MFVPGGWWHAVINLNTTIAVTQNVCNSGNFARVWLATRKGRKRLAYRWLGQLFRKEFGLFQLAVAMNKRDNWVMWESRPRLKAARLKPEMTKSESSNTSQSSSTSSDSSDVSSDDEKTIEMIQNAIPDFESFGRNTINKTKRRYALVIHEIN